MADEKPNVLKRATHSATAPVRNYINNHFEMVKQEVRASGGAPAAAGGGESTDAWARVAELENVLAEQSVHQARVLARLDRGGRRAVGTDRGPRARRASAGGRRGGARSRRVSPTPP